MKEIAKLEGGGVMAVLTRQEVEALELYQINDQGEDNKSIEWHMEKVTEFIRLSDGLARVERSTTKPLVDYVARGEATSQAVITAVKKGDQKYLLAIPRVGKEAAWVICSAWREGKPPRRW